MGSEMRVVKPSLEQDGVVKAKDFRRRVSEERWVKETFNSWTGVPWCPIPSEPNQIELKVRIRMPDEDGQIVE